MSLPYFLIGLLVFAGLMYLVFSTQDFNTFDPWFPIVIKTMGAVMASIFWPITLCLIPVAGLCYYAYKKNKTTR